jgi:hypothetical protein
MQRDYILHGRRAARRNPAPIRSAMPIIPPSALSATELRELVAQMID